MTTRRKQQAGGLIIAFFGGCFTLWCWYPALYKSYFYEKAAMIFPEFLIIGTALIIFHGYRKERIMRGEDISKLHGFKLITTRWRIILLLAIAAGVLNFYLLYIII